MTSRTYLAAAAAAALLCGAAIARPLQTAPAEARELPAALAVHSPPPAVRPGLEVLLRDSLHLVRGRRVGLITNHTAVTADGRSAVDVLHDHPDVRLVALYAPEHGIRGNVDGGDHIANGRDA